MHAQLDSACKRALLLGALAAIFIGPASYSQKTSRPEAVPNWVRQTVEAKNTRREIFMSKTIGQEASYFIYVPQAYKRNAEERYPVMYWLHGMGSGLGGIPQLAKRFDAEIESGKMPPMLVVFINGMRDSFYCDSADGRTPVETVVIKELIPHIDSNYRTVRSRDGRIIEGFSLGGFGAAHLGFKYPKVFGTVSIIDGTLTDVEAMQKKKPELYERIFGSSAERFAAEDPRTLVEKNVTAIRGKQSIRLAVGLLVEGNRSFHEQLSNLNISHDFDTLNVGHNPLKIYDSLGERNWQFYRDALTSDK